MFAGVSVALATPFRGGSLDEDALRGLLGHVLGQGVSGIVATGSTGEAATLSPQERERVWRIVRKEVGDRGFVVAGTGSNSTRDSIENTRRAVDAGVDGCMLVTPYYNKPTADGLVRHFLSIAEAVGTPIMLYNVPGRTGVNMLPDTVARIAEHPGVVAVKEASGSIEQATEILRRTDLTVLAGDDALALPLAAVGAAGVVSVAGHLVGSQVGEMLRKHRAGEVAEAAKIHRDLMPLISALFLETNPAPLKAALAELGIIHEELRLPLVPVGKRAREILREEMRRRGMDASRIGSR